MSSIVCVLCNSVGVNLTCSDILNYREMVNTGQRDMQDICGASDTKLNVSGTTTLHLCMGESYTCVNFCVMIELVVPVKPGLMYIDRFMKWIHPLESKIVPHHTPPA